MGNIVIACQREGGTIVDRVITKWKRATRN